MIRRLVPLALLVAVLTPVRPAAAADLPVVWQQALPGAQVRESSPALVDLDGSGTLDVLVGARDGRLHGLRGTDGGTVAGWPQATTHPINSSPAVGDVTGDGRPEVFVGSGVDGDRTGALYSFTDEGATRFRAVLSDPDFPQGAPVRATPALGDIDGDGGLDATVGSLGVRSLWSFRGDGSAITGDELFYWDDTIFSSAALHDVDRDGRLDAIVGGDSSPGAPIDHRGGMVRAIGGDGRQRWEFLTDDIIRSSPAVGDIDGDGRAEVVFGAGDYWHGRDAVAVFALDAETGRLEWRRETDGVTNSSPALADVDGDGRLDVAIGTFDSGALGKQGGSVYALRGTDGGDLPGFPQASGGGVVLGGITTADVNGDGGQDLFVPTGAFVAVLSGKGGGRLYNLAEGKGIAYQSSPAIADVDADGQLDVVAAGTRTDGSGIVTRWELPASARLGALGWHQFRKDGRRTGSWTTGQPNAGTLPHDRLAGNDRYETAVALSRGATTGAVVYVATGAAFADALAGGPAAAARRSAVLLVGRDELPGATRNRLSQLRPSQILVLGGAAAVSDAVVAQLTSIAPTRRLAGADRYGTAAAVSADAFGTGVPVAYVATGAGFPDALAGGAAAAKQGGPVVLVDRDAIPGATSAELRRLLPREIVVLGGTGAVSAAVESELRTYAPVVVRVAGPDRYATAVEVAERTSPSAPTVFVATGRNFPDALAGSAATGEAPLLLVPGSCLPPVVANELARLQTTRLTLLGGNAAVRGTVAALTPC
jgi:putative cell wall-binding protein